MVTRRNDSHKSATHNKLKGQLDTQGKFKNKHQLWELVVYLHVDSTQFKIAKEWN